MSSKFSPAIRLAVLFLLSACAPPPAVTQPGVSLALAQHRGATISDIHYDLTFDIPADVEAAIPATAIIHFRLSDTSTPLQLDFRESSDKLHAVSVNGESSGWYWENEHLVMPADALRVGRNVVNIGFEAGSSSLNRNPEYLYTLFVPDRARTAFPLFDQPDLKATFNLTLILPQGWTAMSNGATQAVEAVGPRRVVRFERSDLIPSYLFSFVAGKFKEVTREVDGREMTMLHRETDTDKVGR
ncbi:MAG: hypothetical protein VYD01_05310, partial [Pseudomonadota bacterium]|nr:hypothetical protein [Pseudomonadota bacterium]